jgi:4-amino-4-deoxy-L-arabinose transferase-like glycosyltransferase
MTVNERRGRLLLSGLLLLSLILRVGWGMVQQAEPDVGLGDQFEYLEVGRNLVHEHQLRFYDDRFGQWVYAYRTPGYPFLIAACGGNVRVIRLVQALIDTSTVLAIYLLARRFMGQGGALVAGAMVAFNPFLIYFSGLVLSETLFTSMLAWGLYLLVTRLGWGIVLLALATLVRPSALGLAVVLAAGVGWPRGWPVVLRNAGLAILAVIIVLFPWAWRNAHHPVLRSWIWTATNEGITTYDGFHEGATGASDQKPFLQEMRTLLAHMDEVERDEFFAERAHGWIRTHPLRSIQLMGNKIARTWSPFPLSTEYGSKRLYVIIGLCYSLPFYIMIVLGLWSRSLPLSVKVLLLIPAIYFTGIHALSVGSLRYRIPFETPMAVLVGSWASGALGILHGPSRRKLG